MNLRKLSIFRPDTSIKMASTPHRILITGASGYLGGTLLARWKEANLPQSYDKVFALVRNDAQAQAVQQYGTEPLVLNLQDETSVREGIVGNKITIIYYLIDPIYSAAQVHMIKALAEVKKLTGQEVHFLHVSKVLPFLVYPLHAFRRTRFSCLGPRQLTNTPC